MWLGIRFAPIAVKMSRARYLKHCWPNPHTWINDVSEFRGSTVPKFKSSKGSRVRKFWNSRNSGTLEPWSPGTLEPLNFRTLSERGQSMRKSIARKRVSKSRVSAKPRKAPARKVAAKKAADPTLARVRGAERRQVGHVTLEVGRAGEGRVKRMIYPAGF